MTAESIFLKDHPVSIGRQIRKKREEAKLTLSQAALALGVSPITLDNWEQGRSPQVTADYAQRTFKKFRKDTNNCFRTGNNLIFGVFPIRIAKDILGLNVSQMAEKLNYSTSSWRKMEANSRLVPPEKMALIENWVEAAWSARCISRSD